MRGVFVGGNERKRECRECFLLFFSTSFNMFFFFEREIKKGGVCESCDGKELEKYLEYFLLFFGHVTDCLFIFTNCNIIAILALIIMNKI